MPRKAVAGTLAPSVVPPPSAPAINPRITSRGFQAAVFGLPARLHSPRMGPFPLRAGLPRQDNQWFAWAAGRLPLDGEFYETRACSECRVARSEAFRPALGQPRQIAQALPARDSLFQALNPPGLG